MGSLLHVVSNNIGCTGITMKRHYNYYDHIPSRSSKRDISVHSSTNDSNINYDSSGHNHDDLNSNTYFHVGDERNVNNNTNIVHDIITISRHFTFCLFLSLILSFYEGYDCSYLKPEPATIRQFPPERISSTDDILFKTSLSTTTTTTTSKSNILHDIIQLMRSGTRGMGRGEIDRMDGWFQTTYFGGNYYNEPNSNGDNNMIITSKEVEEESAMSLLSKSVNDNVNALRNIKSYNEIMKYHRDYRVQRWKDDDKQIGSVMSLTTNDATDDATDDDKIKIMNIQTAVRTIYEVIEQLQVLKTLSSNYDWDAVNKILQSDLLKRDFEVSCNVLRSSVGYLDYDARQEIGFDWGSCAWRHCGAQADAQEALAELYNSIGLFEPFECLFTIDIVERSLRDILNVVPMKYHLREDVTRLKPYEPYKTQQELNDDDDSGIDSSERDFLKVLSGLRNDYTFDEQ